jgi:hypothetical protein
VGAHEGWRIPRSGWRRTGVETTSWPIPTPTRRPTREFPRCRRRRHGVGSCTSSDPCERRASSQATTVSPQGSGSPRGSDQRGQLSPPPDQRQSDGQEVAAGIEVTCGGPAVRHRGQQSLHGPAGATAPYPRQRRERRGSSAPATVAPVACDRRDRAEAADTSMEAGVNPYVLVHDRLAGCLPAGLSVLGTVDRRRPSRGLSSHPRAGFALARFRRLDALGITWEKAGLNGWPTRSWRTATSS